MSAYHVVGIDLCGHGHTSIPDDDTISVDRFVDDVHAVLADLGRESCHLFGFSLGSSAALRVAARAPDRIDRLALFAPTGRWNDDLVETLNSHLDLGALERHLPRQAARLQEYHRNARRLFPLLRHFIETLPSANEDMIATLDQVPHSTLVAGLDEDLLFSIENTEMVYRHLNNARLAILPGEQHRLVEETVQLLVPLLRRHFGTP
jgi:pimeloyl-ACP methyl ester carboxylesterase